MSVYLIAGINIRDKERYGEYVRRALATLDKHEVEVLAVSDEPVSHEGTNPFRRYVLLKFADQAAFDAWYRSPEYQAAAPIRHSTAETGFFVTVESFSR